MYGKEPKCDDCLPVDLNLENELPFRIFQQIRSQLIYVGMEGVPVDVNIPAVKIVMDFYGVGESKTIFHKVLMAVRAEIHEIHEKRKREKQAKGK